MINCLKYLVSLHETRGIRSNKMLERVANFFSHNLSEISLPGLKKNSGIPFVSFEFMGRALTPESSKLREKLSKISHVPVRNLCLFQRVKTAPKSASS